eukprot:Skav218474  [mRNA]  locus=scaffold538:1069557:1089179:+ [translate_table: standard]
MALLVTALASQNSTTSTTTTIDWVTRLRLDDTYLNPSGNARCPSKCRYYFAGASAGDAVVCQKQASGVGTAQQNAEFGVACFPGYGCGRDMITCVDRSWTDELPNISDAQLACAGLDALTAENPWTCGSDAEGRPACTHDTPNNNVGKWLLADADLGCGWGSTYGGTVPNYAGEPLPYSQYFEASTELECCLKAMTFEKSTWSEGGAALFFELKNGQCRVDREKIIYANMDSSSGRSVKYQNTRCGTGRLFYRHAAGAADAANLHTGGRCVVDGGFKRLNLQTSTNLPKGEIYSMGAELPNHDCDPADTGDGGCHSTLIYNTIADAEACCEQCRSLSWIPQMGGVVETDDEGNQLNPCVAWQIVEGRCRINRKAYYEKYNSGQTMEAALLDADYMAPGNTDWVASTRGCGDSMERCNYYSYIYYRDLQGDAPSMVNSTGNATYRKLISQNISELTENITIQVAASAVESRHDRRVSLLAGGSDGDDESDGNALAAGDGTDFGLVEIYDRSALRSSGDYEIFDEEAQPMPICTSNPISSNEQAPVTMTVSSIVAFTCELAGGRDGRRLLEANDVIMVFTAVGSGYDQVNFQVAASFEEGTTSTTSTTSTSSTSSTSTTTNTTDDSNGTTTKDLAGEGANLGNAQTAAISLLCSLLHDVLAETPFSETVQLTDVLTGEVFERNRTELCSSNGLVVVNRDPSLPMSRPVSAPWRRSSTVTIPRRGALARPSKGFVRAATVPVTSAENFEVPFASELESDEDLLAPEEADAPISPITAAITRRGPEALMEASQAINQRSFSNGALGTALAAARQRRQQAALPPPEVPEELPSPAAPKPRRRSFAEQFGYGVILKTQPPPQPRAQDAPKPRFSSCFIGLLKQISKGDLWILLENIRTYRAQLGVFSFHASGGWVTEASPVIYRIGHEGQEPAVLRTSRGNQDVIKRDVDDGAFFSYQLRKTENTNQPQSFQSDIDPSCSPGYCGFSFQHADDLTDPLCWLKLGVLAILAGYLTTYLLESLQLQKAWNWLIVSAESVISCCLCHVQGYDDLARVEQWGGSYAYAPLCSTCSSKSVSVPDPEDHYKLETSAAKKYSPAILDILDTILNGTPVQRNLDVFVNKLMAKRVFEEPGLVDCGLDAWAGKEA